MGFLPLHFQGFEHLFASWIHALYLGTSSCPSDHRDQMKEVLKLKTLQQGTTPAPIPTSKSAREVVGDGSAADVKMTMSFCHKCDLLFYSQEEFISHRMLNCTKKFTCKVCGTMFAKVQTLMEHLMEVRHRDALL